ncbi:MAG: selenide, water dikinase [Porticoccaceae bacterium]|nr:MAG: selenide, water dikinase [Porticoccaceae bacterium]
MEEAPRLTQFSHGAGCGCKIAPAVLDSILAAAGGGDGHPALLVGNDTRDDAAAYDLGDGQVLLSTADFFTPIADDPFDFGAIAAANALSDIYAMGGEPLMAIALLGWPTARLSAELAGRVVAGGRSICREAGIPLAGGHSIDAPEPIFGLAVTGRVARERLLRNSTARAGDLLFLTKPLGAGILSTALKRGLLAAEHWQALRDSLCRLNRAGARLGDVAGVHAVTDVTGFGLLGHLLELCRGSGLAAEVDWPAIPLLPGVDQYLAAGAVPGGCERNWASYGGEVDSLEERVRLVLCDPQTSGGLLIAAAPEAASRVEEIAAAAGTPAARIGRLEVLSGGPRVRVRP